MSDDASDAIDSIFTYLEEGDEEFVANVTEEIEGQFEKVGDYLEDLIERLEEALDFEEFQG